MSAAYNWQNATDNLLPFQDFLSALSSDKPQEIYFKNDNPLDIILIAITVILLLLHVISILTSHPGITRCFAIILFWPAALNVPVRIVKLFVLSSDYPDTKWLFLCYTFEYTINYIFFTMYLGSFVTYLLMKHKYVSSMEKSAQRSSHFHAPVWVFCIFLSILHFNGNYRLSFFPFYIFTFYVIVTTIACLILIISIIIVQCTHTTPHRRSLLWLLPFFIFSCPSAVYLCTMTVMDMLYFRFKFHGDTYPTAYTQMAFYRPLAFHLNPIFVIAALLITLPESRSFLSGCFSSKDDNNNFRNIGISSHTQTVNVSVKPANSPPNSTNSPTLKDSSSPRLPPLLTSNSNKIAPISSNHTPNNQSSLSSQAPPLFIQQRDEPVTTPRQPHLRQFAVEMPEEQIIANAPSMPMAISPRISPPLVKIQQNSSSTCQHNLSTTCLQCSSTNSTNSPTPCRHDPSSSACQLCSSTSLNSGPMLIVRSTAATPGAGSESLSNEERRASEAQPARFTIKLEPISRPETRMRANIEPVKAGNLETLNPMVYPGAAPSATNKTVIPGALHRLDPDIYPGAAKEIPSPTSKSTDRSLSALPPASVASLVSPAVREIMK